MRSFISTSIRRCDSLSLNWCLWKYSQPEPCVPYCSQKSGTKASAGGQIWEVIKMTLLLLLSFVFSSLFSRWQVIIWIACAPVALIVCSADPCCESLLHQHEARCQSLGGISIPTCYLLSSDKTCCSEMLDLVYEAVAVSTSLTDISEHWGTTELLLQPHAGDTWASTSKSKKTSPDVHHPAAYLFSYLFSFLIFHISRWS